MKRKKRPSRDEILANLEAHRVAEEPAKYSICVQCVPEGCAAPADFIALSIALSGGARKPVSPTFENLGELYVWMRENGWRSRFSQQNPWGVEKCETRIEYLGPVDKGGKCSFSLHWMSDYHPGSPLGEVRWAERGQNFYADPREHGLPHPPMPK